MPFLICCVFGLLITHIAELFNDPVTACAAALQAIGLLDDLDKELNTYAMRVREWYGWHFPEMTKIVADNIAYAKAVSGHVSYIVCYT
jgi:hypothetical protein